MNDWQTLNNSDFPELPEDRAAPVWRRWRWGLVSISLLLAMLVGLGSLRQQRNQGRAALIEDLNDVIFTEETNRFLGRTEAARYQADAPTAWRQSYFHSFEPQTAPGSAGQDGLAEASKIFLASIDFFDGQCALATLANAPHDPVRFYCLAGTEWLRAPIPLPAWGDERLLEPRPGLQLRFRTRDRAFVERLATELAGQAEQLPLDRLEIVVEPHDLAGPLILSEAGRIILNSPEVVPTSTGVGIGPDTHDQWTGLSKPEIVHLALERILIGHAHRLQPSLSARLPGAERLNSAIQTVMAMPVLYDSAAQNRLRQGWRAELAGGWVSPFFAGLLPQTNPVTTGQAEAAALLTAAYLYERHGPEILPELLSRLPQAGSWNQVFADLPRQTAFSPVADQASLAPPTRKGVPEQNYTTLLLEIEAAQYAGADKTTMANLYRAYSQPLEQPPLSTKLRYFDNHALGQPSRFPAPRYLISPAGVLFNWPSKDERLQGWRLYVSQSGQAEPVLVEAASDLMLTTPDGLSLSPGCLGPGADLTINGEWLEAPRRFRASQITVQRALRLSPRPTSSRAYLFVQTNSETGAPSQLLALTAHGVSRPLLDLDPALQLFPLPAAEAEAQRLLIQSDVPSCPRSWFGLYESGRGLINHWFAPAGPRQWVWQPDREMPLFFKLNDDQLSYQLYEGNRNHTVGQSRLAGTSYWFLGWHLAERRLITVGFRAYGSLLGLLNPANDQMTWLADLPVRTVNSRGLSPAGDWLVYPTSTASSFGPSSRLYLQHSDGHSQLTSLRFDPDQWLASLTWSPNLSRPALALLVGRLEGGEINRPTGLLWVDPKEPGVYVEVARANEGEQFDSPIFCPNGDLLYIAKQVGRYELRRQQPGLQAATLLSLDRSFYPLICNN